MGKVLTNPPPATFPKYFYCPATPAQNPAQLWNTAAGTSTWGYVWLNDRGTASNDLPFSCPPRKTLLLYRATPDAPPRPSSSIPAADIIVTDTDTAPLNFTPKAAAVTFGTSHLDNGKLILTNVLFADSHVESTTFSPKIATPIPQPAGGYFWFPDP